MDNQDNVTIVKQVEECFKKGDFDKIREWLAEDVIWEVYGSSDYPLAGRYCGLNRLSQLFELFGKVVAEFKRYEIEEFISEGNKVVVLGHTAVRWFSGHDFETKWVQVFTIECGKVIEFREARG